MLIDWYMSVPIYWYIIMRITISYTRQELSKLQIISSVFVPSQKTLYQSYSKFLNLAIVLFGVQIPQLSYKLADDMEREGAFFNLVKCH